MRWSSAAVAVCGLASTACAGHAHTMADVRDALRRSDVETARARLTEAGRGTDDLLFALEDGLLLHYAGDPELSNARLEFVEQSIDDLYTKSITRIALSLVTSDLILRFEPRGIETFLVNFYRGLNYLQQDDAEGASVEWRKLNSKLQFSREHGDAPYLDPPFFHHVVGLGLEWDDPDNAYVSLRLAEAAYLARDRAPPPDLVADLVRLASALGFQDHLEIYHTRYAESPVWEGRPPGPAGNGYPQERSDWGEVVLFIEEGLVAPISEARVFIPILKARSAVVYEGAEKEKLQLAEDLALEYREGRFDRKTGHYLDGREIDYVVPVSFPVFGVGETAFDVLAVALGPDTVAARPALAVSEMQGAAFADRLLGIWVKTIARALIKYAAAQKLEEEAEEESGEVAGDVVGALANLVNVATERADTRAWLGLPHRIWIARIAVPPGDHDLDLVIDGGEVVTLGPIDVRPLERRFVSFRIF